MSVFSRFSNSRVFQSVRRFSLQPVKNGWAPGSPWEHTMRITHSKWRHHMMWDYVIFYSVLWSVPFASMIFYFNVFNRKATLVATPEDYVPKEWEYERHPLIQFLQKYWMKCSEQQRYEADMHSFWAKQQGDQRRQLIAEVKRLINERGDYVAYGYQGVSGGRARMVNKTKEELVAGHSYNP